MTKNKNRKKKINPSHVMSIVFPALVVCFLTIACLKNCTGCQGFYYDCTEYVYTNQENTNDKTQMIGDNGVYDYIHLFMNDDKETFYLEIKTNKHADRVIKDKNSFRGKFIKKEDFMMLIFDNTTNPGGEKDTSVWVFEFGTGDPGKPRLLRHDDTGEGYRVSLTFTPHE